MRISSSSAGMKMCGRLSIKILLETRLTGINKGTINTDQARYPESLTNDSFTSTIYLVHTFIFE